MKPVCHVSLFEADAFARWSGYRLPTESEWEYAVQTNMVKTKSSVDSPEHHFADRLLENELALHPQTSRVQTDNKTLFDAIGNLWEWTSSQYTAYPGYKSLDGALGEYNGKFMCNQFVFTRRIVCDPRRIISVRPTGISSRRKRAGNFRESDWPIEICFVRFRSASRHNDA